ncbi:MAG: hypothetical protein R3F62_24065 [Planctomycetota bacterium]
MQEVTTRVRYLCGEHPLVEFRAVYGEYFDLGARDALAEDPDVSRDMRDAHAFDMAQDGWTLSALTKLLRTQRILDAEGRPCRCREAARIVCEKRFRLGPGVVEDSPPLKRNGDQAFGFLLHGPREDARAELELQGGPDGTRRALRPTTPFPYGAAGAGRGWFTADAGLELVERFSFAFATDSLRFDDGGGYRPVALD